MRIYANLAIQIELNETIDLFCGLGATQKLIKNTPVL